MKINVGAGKQTWDGFYCIDAVQHPKATRPLDLIHAFEFEGEHLKAPVPLPDGCADEVHSYHFIEHVHEWQAPTLVKEWKRLLKPGGLLVIECPNIELAARNLLNGMGVQWSMWPLYGDGTHRDPLMCHKFGYTPASLMALLKACGFTKVLAKPPVTHGARLNRDMRLEAR